MTNKLTSPPLWTHIIAAFLTFLFVHSGPVKAAQAIERLEAVTLVELFDAEPDQQHDKYFDVLKEVVGFTFLREVKRAPFFKKVHYLKKAELPTTSDDFGEAAEKRARRSGDRYYISGIFIRAGDNLVIKIIWKDFVNNTSSLERLSLGRREVEDFEIVEKKVVIFAKQILERMRFGKGSEFVGEAKMLLVGCFGAAGDKNAFRLGQIIVAEVPYHLQNALKHRGIPHEVLEIHGLNYDEYSTVCREGRLETFENQGHQYTISGAVLTQANKFVVRPIFIDPTRLVPIPIEAISGDFDISNVAQFIQRIANQIADRILVILMQQRLRQIGLYEGVIDGLQGPETKKAIQTFQSQRGIGLTGRLDNPTIESLIRQP